MPKILDVYIWVMVAESMCEHDRNNAKRLLSLRYLDCLTLFKLAPVSKITHRQFYSLEFHTSYQVTLNIKRRLLYVLCLFFAMVYVLKET